MAKIHQAAMLAQIHHEIMAMPMNYMSMIVNMGSALSGGGQKQRILLARTLYQDPKVLFLDEGTANLDVKTEKEIVDIIGHLTLTRIVVAHRPAFIDKVNRTVAIKKSI